ncbi:MAG: hypothetical protein ACRDTJ_17760, partial [Pseudonocardiaceae bacterium]
MGFKDYLTALQRRWPTVIIAGLLGLLIGHVVAPGAANQSTRTSYTATATLLQGPTVEEPVESTALLVTSDAVAGRVSRALSTDAAPQELLSNVAAAGNKTNKSIKITATGAAPQATVALVNAFARGTVDEFRTRIRDAATATFRRLETQLTEVDNQLKQI